MRKILFRAKRVDSAEWVEGFYYQAKLYRSDKELCHYITIPHPEQDGWPSDHFMVLEETVGQFTGLTDKNGKKIFEGDIVRGRHWISAMYNKPDDFHLWRVDWNEKSGLITFVDSPTTKVRLSIHDFADLEEIEAIGNIFDNPELLKGAEV